jgi:ligand-binding sensor domain-containing protein
MEYHKSENKYQQIIYQLFTASDGRVFVGTDAGFSIYNPVTQIFSDFTADNIHATEPDGIRTPRFQFSVKSFAEDKHGNIFIGTWASGVFRYSNHRFYHYPKIGPCNSAYALLFDRYERLWIGTWGYGIYRMNNPHNYRNPRLTHLSSGTTNYVKGNICHQLVEGVEGSVWVATEKGSIYYSSSKGKVVTIYPSVVQGIAKAHNGDIWAITSHEGLQRFTTRSSLFSLFSLFNKKDFLPQSKTLFNIDSQHLLVANDVKGFFVLNSITGTCTPASSLTTLAGSELTQGTLMLDILRKKNGELWMAMNEGGLLI